jgi:hypothetical protein
MLKLVKTKRQVNFKDFKPVGAFKGQKTLYSTRPYNSGQKISSTTAIPLTYAVKHPLGTNNLISHVNMCQSNCVYVLWH